MLIHLVGSESTRPAPPEYIDLLASVIGCLAKDALTPLRTTDEITAWLHRVSTHAVERVLAGDADHDYMLLERFVRCLLAQTHDPRLADWTPAQISDWCQRTHRRDVQAVLEGRVLV